MTIADYDRENGYDPHPHPRGTEVYVLVHRKKLEKALAQSERSADEIRGHL
jgi:hypothetical protein